MFFDLPPDLDTRATTVFQCVQQREERPIGTFIVADMSLPSSEKRLFIFDVSTGFPRLIARDFVAHGSGSDPDKDGKVDKFGATPNSHKTSLGLYQVSERYSGKYGTSFRLDGLTPGFNDTARERAVVLHPAPYVRDNGVVGRSQGCPAVRQVVLNKLADRKVERNAFLWIDEPSNQQLLNEVVASCPPPPRSFEVMANRPSTKLNNRNEGVQI